MFVKSVDHVSSSISNVKLVQCTLIINHRFFKSNVIARYLTLLSWGWGCLNVEGAFGHKGTRGQCLTLLCTKHSCIWVLGHYFWVKGHFVTRGHLVTRGHFVTRGIWSQGIWSQGAFGHRAFCRGGIWSQALLLLSRLQQVLKTHKIVDHYEYFEKSGKNFRHNNGEVTESAHSTLRQHEETHHFRIVKELGTPSHMKTSQRNLTFFY